MTTYTEYHQPEIGSDRQHSQELSIAEMLDHGSISFGRFAVESLNWEKRSVFQYNRRQEELERYKSNGLVAQKKAYFEEYYGRVRARKALQSENQETAQLDPCADVKTNTAQLEDDNSSNDLSSKEEKSGTDTVTSSDSSTGSTVDEIVPADKESTNDCEDNVNKVTVTNETSNILPSFEPENSLNEASVSATSPVTRRAVQQNSHVSDTVKANANKLKKLAPVLRVEGNASSARNKSKLDSRITKDATKASEKSKALPLSQITGKRDNILLPSKSTTRMAASGKTSNQVSSHKQLTEVHSSATLIHPSSARNIVPSSPSGRRDQRKAIMDGKDPVDRMRTSHPVHARAVQNPSRGKPITSGLKDKAVEKRTCPGFSRRSTEMSSSQIRPKVGQYENQRPNSMFIPNPIRNRSAQNIATDCGRQSYGKERKENEVGEGSNTTCRRDPKTASTPASSTQKNIKLVHKGKEESITIRRRYQKSVSTVASNIEKNDKNPKPLYKSGGLRHAWK